MDPTLKKSYEEIGELKYKLKESEKKKPKTNICTYCGSDLDSCGQ